MPLRFSYAGVAQSVAHLIGSEEVTGPIPVASSRTNKKGPKGSFFICTRAGDSVIPNLLESAFI